MKVTLRFDVQVDSEFRPMPKLSAKLMDELADEVASAVCRHDQFEEFAVTTVRRASV
jgi:hypothetical protein